MEDKTKYIPAIINLLEMARCPNCDGSGTIAIPVTKSGTRQISETEYEEIPVEDFEQSLCQWCYERKDIVKKLTPKTK